MGALRACKARGCVESAPQPTVLVTAVVVVVVVVVRHRWVHVASHSML